MTGFVWGTITLDLEKSVIALSNVNNYAAYDNWIRRINDLSNGKTVTIELTYSRAKFLGLEKWFEKEEEDKF
jgi:hypothetical protein